MKRSSIVEKFLPPLIKKLSTKLGEFENVFFTGWLKLSTKQKSKTLKNMYKDNESL